MIVYRIVHKTLPDLLAGSGNEGRWCAAGRKVIYTSSSVSLCCLENLLRLGGSGFSSDFLTIFYEIPDDIKLEEVLVRRLKIDWRLKVNYSYCQGIGHEWIDKKEALVLKVPSAIIPDEFNYIIKTSSSDITKLKVVDQKIFLPDERLDKILKSVDVKKLL